MIRELKNELDTLKHTNEEDGEANLIESFDRTFAENVRLANPSKKFKKPNQERNRGATDPVAHVKILKEQMILQSLIDKYMCRVFPLTLEGPMRQWLKCLPR